MKIEHINKRIAELWFKQRRNQLSPAEQDELVLCLNAHSDYYWRMVKLENLSYIASLTNDTDWLHEICRRIEELQQ